MKHLFLFICIIIFSNAISGQNSTDFKITTTIINKKKAKDFDKKYSLLLPCHDYNNALNALFTYELIDTILHKEINESYITTKNIFGKTLENIVVKKTSSGKSVLSEVWMTPLGHDYNGFSYLDNDKVLIKNYKTKNQIEFKIGKEFKENIDRHCLINQGDTLFYYTNIQNRVKKIFGKDSLVIDFDFYEWNKNTNTTKFLFSASDIITDSMLVPELFRTPSNGIYETGIDVYHWNWFEKTKDNKLLINFAFSGIVQLDLNSNKVDWYWNYNSSSFSKIKGVGDLSNPYYTHNINQIQTGKYKGYYSYFENGSLGDSLNKFKPARLRIFKLDTKANSLEIILDKIFDISSVALGSVHVLDNYIVVNLGMTIPIKEILFNKNKFGKNYAIDFWKNYNHPHVYVYDLQGNEISNYKFPYGFFSYFSCLVRK